MKVIKLEKENCNPCQMVQNYLEYCELDFERVDVFDNPEIAAEYDIASVPVVVLLDDNNEEIMRSVGFKPDELNQIADKVGEGQ